MVEFKHRKATKEPSSMGFPMKLLLLGMRKQSESEVSENWEEEEAMASLFLWDLRSKREAI